LPTAPTPSEGVALKDYFIRVLEDCHPNMDVKRGSVTVKKVSDVLIVKSNTEIDLSNATKNGANELFLQTFDIQLQGFTK
jgi:hypothetical protein